jgi:hypothetical protein
MKKNIFCWRLEGHWRKEQDPDPDPDPVVRSADLDPDPYQDVTDPEHWSPQFSFIPLTKYIQYSIVCVEASLSVRGTR